MDSAWPGRDLRPQGTVVESSVVSLLAPQVFFLEKSTKAMFFESSSLDFERGKWIFFPVRHLHGYAKAFFPLMVRRWQGSICRFGSPSRPGWTGFGSFPQLAPEICLLTTLQPEVGLEREPRHLETQESVSRPLGLCGWEASTC